MWWGLALVLVVFGISAVAHAETFKNAPREETPEHWKGREEPPPRMKPRPRFKIGQKVVDTSTGKPRQHVVDEISGYKNKYGKWTWTYTLTDGTIAGEESLRAAQ